MKDDSTRLPISDDEWWWRQRAYQAAFRGYPWKPTAATTACPLWRLWILRLQVRWWRLVSPLQYHFDMALRNGWADRKHWHCRCRKVHGRHVSACGKCGTKRPERGPRLMLSEPWQYRKLRRASAAEEVKP